MIFDIYIEYNHNNILLLSLIKEKKDEIKIKKPNLKIILINRQNKKHINILKKNKIKILPFILEDNNIVSGLEDVFIYINSITTRLINL